LVSEIFDLKVADIHTHTHTHIPTDIHASDFKPRLKLSAREPMNIFVSYTPYRWFPMGGGAPKGWGTDPKFL